MKSKLLVIMVLVLCGVTFSPVAAQHAPRKKPHVVKDYETKPLQIQAKMTESQGLTSTWKTRPEVLSQSPKQQPAGDYERCEENCPPPGITATPSEVWCVTRAQCASQEGCGCRLFKRQINTQTFDYTAEAEVRVPREPGYGYVCWCTKKKGQ